MESELEEIQCPLCKEQFSEKVKVPMLLPDCGHSYCVQCIEEHSTEVGFESRRRAPVQTEDFGQNDEDLTKESSPFEDAESLLGDTAAKAEESKCLLVPQVARLM